MYLQAIMEQAERERLWRESYGHIPPIIHATYGGKRWVSASIGQLDNKRMYEGPHNTFIDFLQGYIPTKLGIDWWQRELKKPREKRHQILQWSEDWYNFQLQNTERINGLCRAVPDGSGMSYIHFGYELYLVEQQGCLLPPLLKRLRNPDNFQGARYELLAAANCIESGFSIQWLDKSQQKTKHVEFIGTHQVTRDQIGVEAKSRHRDGVLGYQSIEGQRDAAALQVDDLIRKAIAKPSQYAKVAFVDLNYPPATDGMYDQVVEAIKRVTEKYIDCTVPLNMLIFTNFAYHYGQPGHPYKFDPPMPAYILKPAVQLSYSQVTLGLIQQNLTRARAIPEFGPEDLDLKQALIHTYGNRK